MRCECCGVRFCEGFGPDGWGAALRRGARRLCPDCRGTLATVDRWAEVSRGWSVLSGGRRRGRGRR